MGWDATGTMPPPDTDDGRTDAAVGRWGAALAATTAAGALAVAGATWWATRLGGETLAMVVSVVVAGSVAVLVDRVGRRSSRRARRSAVTTTLLVGLAFLALATSGVLVATKVRVLPPTWTAEAERLLAEPPTNPPTACSSSPLDPPELAGFGRVDEWCVSRGSQRQSVAFHQTDPMGGWIGLLYAPGSDSPGVMSQCVAHLDGPWWQTAGADPNCPGGFTFIGGG